MKIGIDCIGVSTSFYCHDGKGRWLLHKRSEKCRDERGAWDSGGGELEFGLTSEENVLKEIQEEYCCKALIQEKLPAITLLRETEDGTKTHWIILPFILLINSHEVRNVKIGNDEKMGEIGWFTLDNLPHMLHSGFKKTIQLYTKSFEKYCS